MRSLDLLGTTIVTTTWLGGVRGRDVELEHELSGRHSVIADVDAIVPVGFNEAQSGLAAELDGQVAPWGAAGAGGFTSEPGGCGMPLLTWGTPVECGRCRETARRSDLAGWAQYGYCASHSRYFWGPRLRLVCTLQGLPVAFALAGAKATSATSCSTTRSCLRSASTTADGP